MKAKKNILLTVLSLFLLLITSVYSSFAQEVIFSANSSARKIGLQDQVQVQYTIKNASNLQTLGPKPEIKDDFHIVGGPYQSNSTQMSFVNGKMTRSQSLTITYVLQPKRIGSLKIPSATATDNAGEEYESNSIPLEVVDGTLAQQRQQRRHDPFGDDPFEALMRQRQRQRQALQQRQNKQKESEPAKVDLDKDLFIKVVVDRSKVYVGEQITASYKLYARLPMNVSISKLPSLNGFWTQDFEMPKGKVVPVEEIIDGQKYQVFTLKKSALFPQQTGTLELDPAEAEGVARIVQKNTGRDPFFDDPFFNSFFMDDPFADDFFGRSAYKDVKVKLKSKPVKIQVMEVPVINKPESYTGAVGRFSVESVIDKEEISTDDVVNLKLTIKGTGNLKLIEPPALDLPNGLVTYDPVVIDTITDRTTTISGTKTITYTITPQTPGDYIIPSIAFSHFNPKTGDYKTINTQPAKLKVKPGENYTTNTTSKNNLTDIHNIISTPLNDISFNSKPIIFSVGYWSMYALPVFAFLGMLFWKRREEELSKDIVGLKSKRANKVALKRLSIAKRLLQESKRTPFYEEISKAIWLYLSDKLHIPLSSLSKENVWMELNNKNITQDIQKELEHLMIECETALYSGTDNSQQMNNVFNSAVDIISKLEESFKA